MGTVTGFEPDDEERYVEDFSAKEDVWFDKDALIPNNGKRCLAKLCYNSFWGKLSDRQNRTRPS